MCFREFGLELQCTTVARRRILKLSKLKQRVRTVVMCRHEVRFDFQRPAIAHYRFLEVSELVLHNAQIAMGLREIGLNLECTAITREGVREAPLVQQRTTQVVVCDGVLL